MSVGSLSLSQSSSQLSLDPHRNLILMVISLELMLLSIGLLLVNISFALDDLIGSTLTLYLLPFAGAESAIALALLVAFYPSRLNLGLYHCFSIVD